MSVVSKADIIKAIKAKIGDDTSDESLALLEDVTDTLNDFESKASDTTDWKKKYEDNDAEWRKKYRDRFESGGSNDDFKDDREKEKPDKPEAKTFESLFDDGKEKK